MVISFPAVAASSSLGFGAFVSYSQRVTDPREDAYIGLAGPIWGAGAGLATLLQNGYPVFAASFAALLLGESFSLRLIAALGLNLAGIGLVLKKIGDRAKLAMLLVGLSFSAALRSILRQAPNIIMIGEIRDLETASIAINASLTGHMVFSTLHTNDAPSAVTSHVPHVAISAW